MSTLDAVNQARLHVVTGKGGTGKTTVAAAWALALAGQGQRVLLTEVEDRQGISQTFDVAPLGLTEERLVTDPSGGSVHALSVDAKAALLEYLRMYYRLGTAGAALERIGAVDFATTIAPGVRDVLLIGKIYEAVRRTTGRRRGEGNPVYDAVVLDAPPTGRIGRFLAVNAEVAGVARVGPIKNQADSITALLCSDDTVVHVVTLPEEMPVTETVEAVAELHAAGFTVGSIVLNQTRDIQVHDEAAAVDASAVQAALARVGVRATVATARALVAQGDDLDAVARRQERLAATLDAVGPPVLPLPLLAEGTDSGGLHLLAQALRERTSAGVR